MPDGRQEPPLGLCADDRRSPFSRRRARARAPCDFTAALLQELAAEPALQPFDDPRFEALPPEETVILLRALAGEMGVAQRGGDERRARWSIGAKGLLQRLFAGCTRVVAVAVAPICSMLLNTDVLAVARRLCAGLAVRRRS